MNDLSDFRSDTVTRPTPAMREAMARAEVGDDVLDGDPTVGALERYAADWLGKEGSLFVASGTMANQVALGAWVRAGDEVIVEEGAHVLLYEAGAMGYLHGAQAVTLRGDRGALDPETVRRAIRPDFIHCPHTALVCVEQTHMGAGGRVLPLAGLRAVREVAAARGVPVHMDGARLANAVVASGVDARTWASCADSVSVCLSKGLGAPVGSIVAGGEEFLARARVIRKRLGGWMRQAGIIAAAGLLGLREGVDRLAEDHALARELAAALDRMPGLSAPPAEVETNLVLVRVEHARFDAAALAARLKEEGVLVLPLTPETLRFVTHRDVGPADLDRLLAALERILG
ncbi:MAG: GntG family PLP-dependent aldolase [Planctomycetota bacterium]